MKAKIFTRFNSNVCYILIAFSVATLVQVQGYAQSIINGNFESWASTSYDKLENWESSNTESIPKTGWISVSKVTDSEHGFAIKMETVANGSDTIAAYIINTAGDPFSGEGGFPYAAQPTNITGYYKYNLPGSDTALLLVIFKNNGVIVSTDIFKIKGTGQLASYTFFSFPLSLTVVPDTVIMAAASSNVIGGIGIEPGSTLYFDEMAFTGSGPMPAIDNGDFENWVTGSYDQLTGWNYYTDNDNIIKALDSYKGMYALELLTTLSSEGSAEVGSVTSGIQSNEGTIGGLPFSNQVDTLFGFYKYFNNSGDNATVTAQFFLNGMNIGGTQLSLPPSAAYKKFEMPVNLPMPPDTMRIDIASSEWPFDNVGSGSTLYIDEIQLSSAQLNTGVSEFNSMQSFIISPNPVKNSFTLDLYGIHNKVEVTITNITGKIVYTTNSTAIQKLEVNTRDFAEGVYLVQIQTGKFIETEKIIISK